MKVIAIIQARMGSTRLPGKVLLEIAGRPLLWHVVRRTQHVGGVDQVIVATSTSTADDAIETLCRSNGWYCFRGSEPDVLDRYYRAARQFGGAHIVRVTADCPLLCIQETTHLVQHHLARGSDYTHNLTVWGSQMPLGTGSEVFTFQALETAFKEGHEPHHREHVDEYIYEHPDRFRIECLTAPVPLQHPECRLTIDTAEDLATIRTIYDSLYRPDRPLELLEVLPFLYPERPPIAVNEALTTESGL